MTETAAQPEAVRIDPVVTPIDQIDLSNPLIAFSVVQRLQDEARYWRQNAACWLNHALHDSGRAFTPGQLAYEQGPERRIREFGSVLGDALSGRFFEACEICDHDVRPGDPVVNGSEVGEMHAACAGATPEQIAAGRMPIEFDGLDTENMTAEEIEAARRDPHLRIFGSAPLYTPDRIAQMVEQARAQRDAEHLDSALQHTPLWQAVDAIAHERLRQISEEGWTPEHDDKHAPGALAYAAANYAQEAGHQVAFSPALMENPRQPAESPPFLSWPWAPGWWKPHGGVERVLVKAGALILAELERLHRAKAARS